MGQPSELHRLPKEDFGNWGNSRALIFGLIHLCHHSTKKYFKNIKIIASHFYHFSVFHLQFRLILNVAVGGNYFPDRCSNNDSNGNLVAKPWSSANSLQMKPFWENKNQWYPTWNRQVNDSHMLVNYIRVYSL